MLAFPPRVNLSLGGGEVLDFQPTNERETMSNEIIDREAVEMYSGKLTDSQWKIVVEEIDGRVQNYIEEIIDEAVEKAKEKEAN